MRNYFALSLIRRAVKTIREERRLIEYKREEKLSAKTRAELELSPLRFSFGRPIPQVFDSIEQTMQSNDIKAQFGKLWRKSLGSQDSNCPEHE
jgi:hypothetical protein